MIIEHRLPIVVNIGDDYDSITKKEMWRWCISTFGNDRDIWSWDNDTGFIGTFYFENMADANWFILKWK